jgi:hypothetical protein
MPGHSHLGAALPDAASLRAGDLVFRVGAGGLAPLAIRIQQQGGWTHVGMLSQAHGEWVVIHSAPPDEPGEFEGVREESLQEFVRHADEFGIYRHRDPKAAALAADAARQYLGEPFDATLNGQPAHKYCSELIVAAYQHTPAPLNPPRTSLHNAVINAENVIMPEDLARVPELRRVDGE